MATYKIAVLPGDGIGQEVTPEAVRVLRAVGKRAGVTFEFEEALIGGAAIDAAGTPLPSETLALCRNADASSSAPWAGRRGTPCRKSSAPSAGCWRCARSSISTPISGQPSVFRC